MPSTVSQPVDLLALHRHNPERYPFLLQSAVVAEPRPATARYDILFAFPGDSYALWADNRITRNGEAYGDGDFLALLDRLWREEQTDTDTSPDLPFTGGWFVYLGYELAGQIEPRLALPKDAAQPVAVLVRIPAAVIHDHQTGQTSLVAEPAQESILKRIEQDIARAAETTSDRLPTQQINMDADDPQHYLRGVERIKHYIVEGDVFQVNLSRGWQGVMKPAPAGADLYQQLCQTNPAPFAALAQLPGLNVISSSPERLVKISGGRIETRPIAGTRPRGKEQHGDTANLQELIGHPKERAEHIMLIDLERNDLGRVCEPGSVEVDELMGLETYAHVHHIVSNVTGRLREDVTPGEAIRAVFPGGTITGCPKERCMAIIAELEQVPRGAYTGSLGYLNHNGDLDLNILIRTITQQGEYLALRAGAGLVFDSIGENELQETEHKARGMLLALGAVS
ncbi:aminodeoxychorismate synthase component I [Thiohalophilus sp.]|uniref:aminodeoxychorismate synthase component I n=1 Tax=Thiohalophilus sp. TaxID=3028392 RepID=UPI002ACDA65E|nr:aminodeoxychorismate synthase component I [Thiohalophilus sp.]MDZ7663043.1 aminodeoxychorismate synthase component I [Thiohalophilus sp.]